MVAMAKLDYDKLNAAVRYVMFSAFAAKPGVLGYDEDSRAAVIDETATFLKQQEDGGVVVRGLYDVAGMRADADFMIWATAFAKRGMGVGAIGPSRNSTDNVGVTESYVVASPKP